MPRSIHRFARAKSKKSVSRNDFSQFTSHRRVPLAPQTRRYARVPGRMVQDDLEERRRVGKEMVHAIVDEDLEKLAHLIAAYAGDIADIVSTVGGPHDAPPLRFAVSTLNEPAILLLLENGADVNVRDREGWTPVQSVFFVDEEDYVKMKRVLQILINSGANVNDRSTDEKFPDALSLAAITNQPELGMMLLHAGADATAENDYGESPLHHHADAHGRRGSETNRANHDFLYALIRQGDVNKQNKYGDTPLLAVLKTNIYNEITQSIFDTMRALVQGGTNIDLENSAGQTAREMLQTRAERGEDWAAYLLEEADKSSSSFGRKKSIRGRKGRAAKKSKKSVRKGKKSKSNKSKTRKIKNGKKSVKR